MVSVRMSQRLKELVGARLGAHWALISFFFSQQNLFQFSRWKMD